MVKVAGSIDPYMRSGDYLFRVHNYKGLWEVTGLMVKKNGRHWEISQFKPVSLSLLNKNIVSLW